MKHLLALWTILVVLLLAMSLAYAQDGFDDNGNPNDPKTNERANACYDGGQLAGTCDTSDLNFNGIVEEWEIERMWECGWHYIRWQAGMVSREDFAPQCVWLLPPIPPPDPKPPTPEPTQEVINVDQPV